MKPKKELFFEESLLDDWAGDLEVMEVPLGEKPLVYVGIAALVLGIIVAARALFLGTAKADFYTERAEINLGKYERLTAPRGIIKDRLGEVLAENKPVFSAFLDVNEFLRRPELQTETLKTAGEVLDISANELWQLIRERDLELSSDPILLKSGLDQSQVVLLKSKNLPTLRVENSFNREYPEGEVFASVIGYIGLTTPEDLRRNPELSGKDFVGKSGLEAIYDAELRGKPGLRVKIRDAKGKILDEKLESLPQAGRDLSLTIDADLERYFYRRMQEGLAALGRRSGAGLAMNPKTGEILALLSFPSFDNNVFTVGGKAEERMKILTDPQKPIFNRAISGLYAPGSTIKPLVGVAALAEKVISPRRTIFSPGYMDVPNPYDPERPSRFLDWRYQGEVDLYSAIAQSSNVYFYLVGGGSVRGLFPPEVLAGGGGIEGLGISRLREWWEKFGLGKTTGVDLPGETAGFLPSPEWKEKRDKRPWLLGDTYNVSIGQGDILVTPLQLLNYISAIASGGVAHRPFLKLGTPPQILYDLSAFAEEIKEVQRGMREAVTSPQGTAHALNDLALEAAAKTGSAQVEGNRAENAFFVGYAPYDDPQIAVLVLVENARQGSLNAVPIAKDVLSWYYWNRIVKRGT
jgi:penicillin-binding protein 2